MIADTDSSLHAGKLFMLLLSSADFYKINFFKKFFQEHYQIDFFDALRPSQ